jgi:hypothetical protein
MVGGVKELPTRLAVPPVASATRRERLTPRAHFYAPKHVISVLDVRRYAALTEPSPGNGPAMTGLPTLPHVCAPGHVFVDRDAGTPGPALFFARGRRHEQRARGARQPAALAARPTQRQARGWRARGCRGNGGGRREGGGSQAGRGSREAGQEEAGGHHPGEAEGQRFADGEAGGPAEARREATAQARTAGARRGQARAAGYRGAAARATAGSRGDGYARSPHGRRAPRGEGRRGGAQDGGPPAPTPPRPLIAARFAVTRIARIGSFAATRAGYIVLR